MAGGKKKQQMVCRDCHRVVEGAACSICGFNLTSDWAGYW